MPGSGQRGQTQIKLVAGGRADRAERPTIQLFGKFALYFFCIVHHTDAEREWACDRDSHIDKLDQALDKAFQRGWLVIDMKDGWNTIYPDTGD